MMGDKWDQEQNNKCPGQGFYTEIFYDLDVWPKKTLYTLYLNVELDMAYGTGQKMYSVWSRIYHSNVYDHGPW